MARTSRRPTSSDCLFALPCYPCAAPYPAVPSRQGRHTRRYLSLDPVELYPGRPDLSDEYAIKLPSGWWMSTNHSRQTIAEIIEAACGVAGHDVSFGFGE